MKGLIVLTLTLVLHVVYGEEPAEPLPEGCFTGSIPVSECCAHPSSWMQSFANPSSCYSFYTCLVGHPVWMPCLDGQHWSVSAGTCLPPEEAGCSFATTTSTTPLPLGICRNTPRSCRHGLLDPEMCCKGVPDQEMALLQNKEDCGTYYQCVHWKPVLQRCQPGLRWNADSCRCEWGESSTCPPNEN